MIASANSVSGPFETICYCCPGVADKKTAQKNVHFFEHPHPEQALVDDLITGKIDAAVRGTLPSNATLKALKKAMGVDHLERIALLETVHGKKFLLTPVGVDEGWTVAEKLELIKKGRSLQKNSAFRKKPASFPEAGWGISGGTRRWMPAWPRRNSLPGLGMPPTARS